jgi:hypothetical protein
MAFLFGGKYMILERIPDWFNNSLSDRDLELEVQCAYIGYQALINAA